MSESILRVHLRNKRVIYFSCGRLSVAGRLDLESRCQKGQRQNVKASIRIMIIIIHIIIIIHNF